MSRPEKPRAMPFTDEHKYLYTDPVFIIGNGKSRDNFDLEVLRKFGTIVGCNALYRDFMPDILIAIDAKMINEIRTSKYEGLVVTPANRSVSLPRSLKWKTHDFNTSGCFSIKLVNELLKPKKCYMIGMDGYPGNMYDNTLNYSPNTLQNFSGVNNFYLKTFQRMPSQKDTHTIFVNVNLEDKWHADLPRSGRYEFMHMDEFNLLIKNGNVVELVYTPDLESGASA